MYNGMFWLLMKTCMFITYCLIFTRNLFSTLLHTCALQNVPVANALCSECCSPSRLLLTTAYKLQARIKTKHNEFCLLYHRIAYEQRWLRKAACTCSFQLCFTTKTRSHLYWLADGLRALARSNLTAANCQEPAARSQQQAATSKQQATNSKQPAASIQ